METEQLNQEIDKLTSDPVDRLLDEKKPASSGAPIAILALLIAMASVSASAWHWWQTRQEASDNLTRNEALTQLQANQDALSASIASIETQLGAAQSAVETNWRACGAKQARTRQRSVRCRVTSVHSSNVFPPPSRVL